MMDSAVLAFTGVSKSFAHKKVLSEVSLQIQRGEIVALLGPNGAGKSTMVNIAVGLLAPESGQVCILGGDPRQRKVKQKRGWMPQEIDFPKSIRVKELLEFVKAHYAANQLQFIENLGLADHFHRYCRDLSGGVKRKLALCCALVGQPQLALLDEPTANVDLEGQKEMRKLLRDYFLGSQNSLVFSSHNISEVEELADRVIILCDGRVVCDKRTCELKQLFSLSSVDFLSDQPEINLKTALRVEQKPGGYRVLGTDSDQVLREIVERDASARQIEIRKPVLEEAIDHYFRGRVG